MQTDLNEKERSLIKEAYQASQDRTYHWGGDGIVLHDEQMVLMKIEKENPVEFNLREVEMMLDWFRWKEGYSVNEKGLVIKLYHMVSSELKKQLPVMEKVLNQIQEYEKILSMFPVFSESEKEKETKSQYDEISDMIKKFKYKILVYNKNVKEMTQKD